MDATQPNESVNLAVFTSGLSKLSEELERLTATGRRQEAEAAVSKFFRALLPDEHPSKEPGARVLEGEEVFMLSAFESTVKNFSDMLRMLLVLKQFGNTATGSAHGVVIFMDAVSSFFIKERPYDTGHFADYLSNYKPASIEVVNSAADETPPLAK